MSNSIDFATSFSIKERQLSNRLIQAPLAGISCAPFRQLFHHYKPPAYAVTEMISGHSLINLTSLAKRYWFRSPTESTLAFQLSGNDPAVMFDAVQIAERCGADIIDLNVGCPKHKIRKKGCGSALLEQPETLRNVVQSMRKATDLPLTVKIRLHPEATETNELNESIGLMLEASGADALVVHGRRHCDDYCVPVNMRAIKRLVDAVQIPVIANGDIMDGHSLATIQKETGAAAYMIGRGGIGRPWLYQSLLQQGSISVTWFEQFELFRQHMELLAELEQSETIALFQGRRLLKWYFKDLEKTILAHCFKLEKLSELYQFLHEIVTQYSMRSAS